MGKHLITLPAREGFKLWAPSYDRDINPLIALEESIVRPILQRIKPRRIVDICAGTGRWMSIGRLLNADVFGADLSREMLVFAADKADLAGRLIESDATALPFSSNSADLAICSFGISYIPCLASAVREMARVSSRLMVSDMHPDAIETGWSRSFHISANISPNASGDASARTFCISQYRWSFDALERAARAAGLQPEHSIEACFGEPEQPLFARAGKQDLFDEVSRIPAIFVKTWVRAC